MWGNAQDKLMDKWVGGGWQERWWWMTGSALGCGFMIADLKTTLADSKGELPLCGGNWRMNKSSVVRLSKQKVAKQRWPSKQRMNEDHAVDKTNENDSESLLTLFSFSYLNSRRKVPEVFSGRREIILDSSHFALATKAVSQSPPIKLVISPVLRMCSLFLISCFPSGRNFKV